MHINFKREAELEKMILNDYLFDSRSHDWIAINRFNEKERENNKGWTAGNFLRERGITEDHKGKGDTYMLLSEDELRKLPKKIQSFIREKKTQGA